MSYSYVFYHNDTLFIIRYKQLSALFLFVAYFSNHFWYKKWKTTSNSEWREHAITIWSTKKGITVFLTTSFFLKVSFLLSLQECDYGVRIKIWPILFSIHTYIYMYIKYHKRSNLFCYGEVVIQICNFKITNDTGKINWKYRLQSRWKLKGCNLQY